MTRLPSGIIDRLPPSPNVSKAVEHLQEAMTCFPDRLIGSGVLAIQISAARELVRLALKELGAEK